MPEKRDIPRKSIYRLSLYSRCLSRLRDNKVATVSSETLAKAAGVKPAQLRKDLTYLGNFGRRGLGYNVIDRLKEIAGAHNASVAQVSLAWTLAKPYVSSVIIGASKPTQLKDNLGALDLALTKAELDALDEITAPITRYPQWMLDSFPDNVSLEALR